MRKWFWIVVVILLAAGCRHKEQKKQKKTVDTIVVADTTYHDEIDDTVGMEPGNGTVEPEKKVYDLTLDSMEVTNLRLLTRKQKTIYDKALLIGEWTRGTEHEIYLSDGTGRMWDEADDVARNEAQSFEWSLDSNLLTIICKMELGGVLPKRYVVTFADDESLAYKDLYGNAFLWDKK